VSLPPLICLITPGHVSTTPRLVKNADALAEAGYRVHVVSSAPFPPADALDAEILASAKWGYSRANARSGARGLARKVLRRAARRLVRLRGERAPPTGLAARALFDESRHLALEASRIPADFYLGHCLASLAPASDAARARGCSYGFDIEDYHDAETAAAMADPVERLIRRTLQRRLLPGCRLLTCSAPLIARRYAEDYGREPLVILNAFPVSQAPATYPEAAPYTERHPAAFYWFSQTVGPDRGLEGAVEVLSRMKVPAELHLRGFVAPEYAARLEAHVTRTRLGLLLLPPASPNEMVRLAASADIGLSVEQSEPPNRDICLTNKVFVYLLAGIPQLMTDTAAHRAFAPGLGEAAMLCSLGRAGEAAAALDSFLSDGARVAAARKAARDRARGRFCWDLEKGALLDAVRRILPLPA
jgi:hypothetical protein